MRFQIKQKHPVHQQRKREDPTYPARFAEADERVTRALENRAFQLGLKIARWDVIVDQAINETPQHKFLSMVEATGSTSVGASYGDEWHDSGASSKRSAL
jgi:hypothetical protein